MMELHQLRHFVAIVDTASFTKASVRAGVSQPALSASIAKLEDELGVKLLHRTPKAVSPTLPGRRLLVTAREILGACERVKADLRSADLNRPTRIGVLRTLPTMHLARLIESFQAACPEANIEIYDGTRDELQERLVKRKVAACITIAGPAHAGQTAKPLLREGYGLAVGLRHRFAALDSICLADLQDERFIVRTQCETFVNTTKLLGDRGITTRVVYKTDQDDRALALVVAGLGVALMPMLFDVEGMRKIKVRDFTEERAIELRWNDDATDPRLELLAAFATSFNWQGANRNVKGIARGQRNGLYTNRSHSGRPHRSTSDEYERQT